MGKAPHWIPAESTVVAQSWIEASEDGTEVNGGLSGSDQDKDQYWSKVMENIQKRAPADAMRQGRYHHRGVKPIKNFWRDNIAKECNAFNRALMIVYNSNPTGCTEQNKINMAVAIHKGKVERMEYRFKDYEPRNWKFYGAWQVLKGHRKFLPPQAPANAAVEEEEEEMPALEPTIAPVAASNNENVAAADNGTDPATVPVAEESPDSARELFATPTPTPQVSKRSRGNGPGRFATKQQAALMEHRAKKIKAIEALTEVQRERQATNKKMADNNAIFQAFMMANAGLKANKDDEYWSEFYRKKMNDLMQQQQGSESDDDDEEEEE